MTWSVKRIINRLESEYEKRLIQRNRRRLNKRIRQGSRIIGDGGHLIPPYRKEIY
jgi:hypothetical protein